MSKTMAEVFAERAAAKKALHPLIDYYRNAEAKEASATTTVADLIAAIRSDEFKTKVENIRVHRAAGNKKQADIDKRELPAVSISGATTGLRKSAVPDGRFTHSGFLQIDIDGKDNPEWSLADLRSALISDPRIVALFISPSGDGIKAIARISSDVSLHKRSFFAAEAHFKTLGINIDKSCKDPVRLCFLSHDPNAFLDLSRTAIFDPVDEVEDVLVPLETRRRAEVNTEWTARPQVISATVGESGNLLLHDVSVELSLDDLREMIDCIPQPEYQDWIEICSAAWNTFGPDATAILNAAWPEVEDGEYAKKFIHRLQDFKQGTLWFHAGNNGWKPSKNLRDQIDAKADVRAALTTPPPATTGSTMQAFAPGDLYYDAPTGKYLLQVGNAFHTFGRSKPIVTGVTRYLAPSYEDAKELKNAVAASIASREIDGAIQWSGSIAGHKIGRVIDQSGMPILITSEAIQPKPVQGSFPLIEDIITQAFPNETALEVFLSWLSSRYKSVQAGIHVPAPMLVIAGEVNSGKSLLAWLVTQMLGKRSANPWSAWSGNMLWNDDLIGNELLLIDDCAGNPDIRARRAFGAAFKEAMYPQAVQMRKRHQSSISVRPVWSVLVCCNDTPEALNVIPPLEPDVSDKIALLHVSKVNLPVDTSSSHGRDQLQRMIMAEAEAFAYELVEWVVPVELRDTRSGILAWRDPELLGKVDATSPEKQLLELLRIATDVSGNRFDIWNDMPCELTATEIQSRLVQSSSVVKTQALQLLNYSSACGIYLKKLVRDEESGITISAKTRTGINLYKIEL